MEKRQLFLSCAIAVGVVLMMFDVLFVKNNTQEYIIGTVVRAESSIFIEKEIEKEQKAVETVVKKEEVAEELPEENNNSWIIPHNDQDTMKEAVAKEMNKRGLTGVTEMDVVEIENNKYPVEVTIAGSTVPIEPVGLTENGAMDVVDSASIMSWYEYGAIPGGKGNALLSGHRDWKGDLGTLFGMERYKKGDKMTIKFDDGSKETFKLTELSIYPANNVPKEVLNVNTGERVTLISCVGTFNRANGGYQDRVIAVFKKI